MYFLDSFTRINIPSETLHVANRKLSKLINYTHKIDNKTDQVMHVVFTSYKSADYFIRCKIVELEKWSL